MEIIDPRTNETLAAEEFAGRGVAAPWAKAQAFARSSGTAHDRRVIEECWILTEKYAVPVDITLTGPMQTSVRVTTAKPSTPRARPIVHPNSDLIP
ncbi:MAG: hypothetical protein EOP24_41275 [Hyphomicrobiales bacterium]|nr:MAG: hypothetical protein EOP24_41275 [Hyphomicrobiales bacterium]